MLKDKDETVEKLIALGFVHYYDSDIIDPGTRHEFRDSVFKMDIKDFYLEATLECDGNGIIRRVEYNLSGIPLSGRKLTIADINTLRQIL